jgi:hypothetical protein
MDCVVADGGELHEAAVFLGFFKELTDPRQPGKVIYPLDEVLLLSLLGVLAGQRPSSISLASAIRSWPFPVPSPLTRRARPWSPRRAPRNP